MDEMVVAREYIVICDAHDARHDYWRFSVRIFATAARTERCSSKVFNNSFDASNYALTLARNYARGCSGGEVYSCFPTNPLLSAEVLMAGDVYDVYAVFTPIPA